MFANCYLFSGVYVCGEGSGCLPVSVLVSIWTCRSPGMSRDPPVSVSQTNTGFTGMHHQAWPLHRFWGSSTATHEWVTNIIDWALSLARDCGLHTCKGMAYESSSYWLSESVCSSLHREAEAEEAASPRQGRPCWSRLCSLLCPHHHGSHALSPNVSWMRKLKLRRASAITRAANVRALIHIQTQASTTSLQRPDVWNLACLMLSPSSEKVLIHKEGRGGQSDNLIFPHT